MLLVTTAGQAIDFPIRRDGNMRKRKAFGPERAAELNPLLSLMEDWMKAPGGYVEHIHRGYSTVTLVLGGRVTFKGSTGEDVTLAAGDAQWVDAGLGHSHSELPTEEGEAHIVQLWLNQPAAQKRDPARVQNLLADSVPVIEGQGCRVRVLAGTYEGKQGPMPGAVQLLDFALEPGAVVEVPIGAGRIGMLYVIEGDVVAATHGLHSGGLVQVNSKVSDVLPMASMGVARVLLVLAPPLAEHVEVSGPFVLNTKSEVKKSYDDFRSGFFDRLKPQG